ncbi:hypothetical protein TSUD_232650 [Trifolium subterraneum]|uniref:Retrotransposon gag domain-containing protein n=1 Tax=Trifolium subterraneum TaxID=3900 RepID=A0A2Z6M5X0_TRISU|nr:hypothetical protein TSUD_232650 [Trifolium subterraneum]
MEEEGRKRKGAMMELKAEDVKRMKMKAGGKKKEHFEAVRCRLFLTTLFSKALSLFYGLPPKSIRNFQELVGNFVNDFAFNKELYPNTPENVEVSQTQTMSVRNYIFTVIPGMRNGYFKSFITQFPPKNLHELWEADDKIKKKDRETYEDEEKRDGDRGDDENDNKIVDDDGGEDPTRPKRNIYRSLLIFRVVFFVT